MAISVATYALRNALKDPSIGVKGIADFLVHQKISLVELNNCFTTPEGLHDFALPFIDRGIKPNQLTVDGNNFFVKGDANHKKQFEYMKKWLDAGHKENIPLVRANMGHALGLFKKTDTIENLLATFTPILGYAESLGMKFVFENHGGKSSDINFQLKVREAISSKNFGYLLDTGNYKPKDLIYENIPKLGKSILIVHAKTYNFDAEGNETQLDFKRIVSQLKSIGYTGDYSVEYEGPLPDYEGTSKTIALLRKLI